MDTQYQIYGQHELLVLIPINRNNSHIGANTFLRKVSLNKLKYYSGFLEKRYNRPTQITWPPPTI